MGVLIACSHSWTMLCHVREWMPLRATIGLQVSLQWPSRRDKWYGSDPPRRWHGQCTSAGPAVPIREAKRGGRSRPPQNAPTGTAEPRVGQQLQRAQQVRDKCPRTSKDVFRAHAPRCPMCAPRSAPNATFPRSESGSGQPVASSFSLAADLPSPQPHPCHLLSPLDH